MLCTLEWPHPESRDETRLYSVLSRSPLEDRSAVQHVPLVSGLSGITAPQEIEHPSAVTATKPNSQQPPQSI